ncbi:MAG: hypothetical protein CMB48_03085 [Euryarchaeota archaeon]|nr:hypothetical protein [Euryarchaeota archaeon]|tara:strand:+ start:2766 stop:3704 length:939 start_codon:yes stop_codon:yes gene_type:complete
MAIRRGRKDAKKNLENHEAIDDAFAERRALLENEDSGQSERFVEDPGEQARIRKELEDGGELHKMLGIDENLSTQQQASLQRLEQKWMSGLQGTYNAAEEDRKPLMISFDDEDNLQHTEIGSVTILGNNFDGGEEIRLEYPGKGTEFYTLDYDDELGWRKGRDAEHTARNIASIINKRSSLVHAFSESNKIIFELRDSSLNPDSLVIFVDDPGGQDMIAEKQGVELDSRDMTLQDYQEVIKLALADGIITPSEDQMLWSMRQVLNISEDEHVHIVRAMFGDDVLKECTACNSMAILYPDHSAWYCETCENWV